MYFSDLYLFVAPYYAAKTERKIWSESCYISLRSFGPHLGKIAHVAQQRNFGDFFPVIFIYLLCIIMLQSLKMALDNSVIKCSWFEFHL